MCSVNEALMFFSSAASCCSEASMALSTSARKASCIMSASIWARKAVPMVAILAVSDDSL